MLHLFLNRVTFLSNLKNRQSILSAGLQPSTDRTINAGGRAFFAIFVLAIFILACTAKSKDLKSSDLAADTQPASEQKQLLSMAQAPTLQALEDYKETLRSRGEILDNQGILIESLDGKQTLA